MVAPNQLEFDEKTREGWLNENFDILFEHLPIMASGDIVRLGQCETGSGKTRAGPDSDTLSAYCHALVAGPR